jgi:RHS repeat-associated protein
VDLTWIKQPGEPNGDAGDQYTGLDRFGRVVDQRWIPAADPQDLTDRFRYGYDRDGNPLYRDNLVYSAFGELYHANGAGNGYDNFNQLTAFARGALNPTDDAIDSPSHTQSWTLDALGNWTGFTNDGATQGRGHNLQNQITSIDSGLTTPAYDNNGNTTTDDNGNTYVYDAWNRLVGVTAGGTTLAYGYDALGRRVTAAVNGGTPADLYYSSSWQVVEEQVAGATTAQYVWSPVYVDAMVERDAGGQRLYVQQDANWNVTALVDTTGAVRERYVYDPYGKATVLDPATWAVRGAGLYGTSAFGWVYLHQGGRYERYSDASGLYLFRHRDYSPTLGRWMQQDPIGYAAGDSNLYRYVGNNPTNITDPNGLRWTWGDVLVGAGTAFVVAAGAVAIVGTGGLAAPLVIGGAAAVIGGGLAGQYAESTDEAATIGIYTGLAVGVPGGVGTTVARFGVVGAAEIYGEVAVSLALGTNVTFRGRGLAGPVRPRQPGALKPPPGAKTPNAGGKGQACPTAPKTGAAGQPPKFVGLSEEEIVDILEAEGFTRQADGANGGRIWTKDLGNGNSIGVRIDDPVVQGPPVPGVSRPTLQGFADEVPHVHKEIFPTANKSDWLTRPVDGEPWLTKLDDSGTPSTNPGDVHIRRK